MRPASTEVRALEQAEEEEEGRAESLRLVRGGRSARLWRLAIFLSLSESAVQDNIKSEQIISHRL